MRYLLILCLAWLSSQAMAEHNQLSLEQIQEGWISLFDGKTLFGWEATSDANWRVEQGILRVDAGQPGWLMTTSRFAEFELEVEFRCGPNTNSGIFLHSAKQPTDPKADCLELNIAPQKNPFPTGTFVERTPLKLALTDGAGGTDGTIEKLNPWDGNWHRLRISLTRESEADTKDVAYRATATVDGLVTSSIASTKPSVGHIGLQFREGEIEFRSIRLKPGRLQPLFNGKDLTGWNTKRAEVCDFEVIPQQLPDKSELRILNGRGQLESDASYGNFVLQLECFINGDALNSGVFFRCIPGDFMMGYECQIHNGMVDGDPTQPQDCGTGGIFRRQNARRIVARDREWFGLTLIADGPHMAAWVNGYQVSDWTDTRPTHENPRKGLRTEPGTLAIQGHDPTTDLRFRDLKIRELPKD